MEVISSGASITAIVAVALQSTKVIYNTITGIRDGPREIRQLASALDDLHHILKQLEEINTEIESTTAYGLSELKRLIGECSKDLDDFELQLEKLQEKPNEKNLGKTWKRVKTVLRKEDFRKMWDVIHHHIPILKTQLSLFGR